MKKIIYTFFVLTAAIVACEQEDFPGSGLESLRDFTLTPVPNSRIALNSLEPDGEFTISWQPARSGFESKVIYTWMFDEKGGNFSAPLLSLPSDNDGATAKITFTNEALEQALDAAGVPEHAEIEGIWAVRATNGDITKTSESNVLTLMRYSEAIMSFDLLSPIVNEAVFLKESMANEEIIFSWEPTISGIGTPIKYKWIADEQDGDFSTPVLTLDADNNGTATTLTLTHQEWESALTTLGVEAKGKKDLKWSVMATAGDVKQMSDQSFNTKLVRWGTELRLTIEDVPAVAPSGKDIFAAGEFGFLGAGYEDWQMPGSNPALKFTKDVDDTYYLDINVPKGTTFQYKFAMATTNAPTWDNGEQKFNIANNGCEGTPNRQFTFDGTTSEVTHSVISWEKFCPFDVVELTFELKSYPAIPSGYSIYLAGSFGDIGYSSWNEPGSNPEFKLEKGSDNVYRKKLLVAKSIQTTSIFYKYFLVPDGGTSWGHGEQSFSTDGCQGLHNGAEGDNRKYNYALGDGSPKFVEANVVTWEGFCLADNAPRTRLEVTVPAGTPANMDVYVTGDLKFAGNFESVWKQPGTNPAFRMRPVTGQPNKFEIYLPLRENVPVEFKFFLATTAAPNWSNGEQKINSSNNGCEGVPNRTFTFDGTNEFTGTVISWEGFCSF
jgi:hypothetical protein